MPACQPSQVLASNGKSAFLTEIYVHIPGSFVIVREGVGNMPCFKTGNSVPLSRAGALFSGCVYTVGRASVLRALWSTHTPVQFAVVVLRYDGCLFYLRSTCLVYRYAAYLFKYAGYGNDWYGIRGSNNVASWHAAKEKPIVVIGLWW